MAEKDRAALRAYFEIGKRPTQEQFSDLIDSTLNKTDDGINITATGNIGIGTATPSARLEIVTPDSWNQPPLRIGSDDQNQPAVAFKSGTAAFSIAVNNAATDAFTIAHGAVENSLVIHDGGYVGIGTINPENLLHVRGDNATLRLSSSAYHGGTGGAINTILSSIKFSNRDDNHAYRAEIRGLLTGDWAEYVGLAFTTNSGGQQIERMRINHNGNIGIGTNNPSAKVHIQQSNTGVGTTVASAIIEATDAALDLISSSDGDWGSGINFIEGNGNTDTDIWSIIRTTSVNGTPGLKIKYGSNTSNPDANPNLLTITPQGNVGIGTTNPTAKLDVTGSVRIGAAANSGFIQFRRGSDAGLAGNVGFLGGGTEADNFAISSLSGGGFISFITNGPGGVIDERLRIAYDGNVGIGTTTPSYKLHVNGTICGSNVAPSDQRLKKNIKSIQRQAIDKLRLLRGVTFQHKEKIAREQNLDQRQHFGFLAQEVKAVFPELVYGEREGNGMLSLSYTSLIPVLVEAFKDLDEKYRRLQDLYQQSLKKSDRSMGAVR